MTWPSRPAPASVLPSRPRPSGSPGRRVLEGRDDSRPRPPAAGRGKGLRTTGLHLRSRKSPAAGRAIPATPASPAQPGGRKRTPARSLSLAARRPSPKAPARSRRGPAWDGPAWRSGRRCSWRPAAWPGARPPCSSRRWQWGSPGRAGTRSCAWSSRRRGRGPRAPGPASGTPTGTGAGLAAGAFLGPGRPGRSVWSVPRRGGRGRLACGFLFRFWPQGWLWTWGVLRPLF